MEIRDRLLGAEFTVKTIPAVVYTITGCSLRKKFLFFRADHDPANETRSRRAKMTYVLEQVQKGEWIFRKRAR